MRTIDLLYQAYVDERMESAESGGRYILDDYDFSRNHTKAQTIKRWKRNLKKKARSERRRVEHKAMSTNDEQ